MARRVLVLGATLVVYLVVVVLFIATLRSLARSGADGFALGPRVALVELEGVILDTGDFIHLNSAASCLFVPMISGIGSVRPARAAATG